MGVALRDPGMGAREAGVEIDGLCEQAPGEPVGMLVTLVKELTAAQVQLVRVHVAGRRLADGALLAEQQCDLERRDDAAGDIVLHREHVRQHPVVALRPQVPAGGRVDELRRDPDPLAYPAHAALQDVADAQPGARFPGVHHYPFKGEGGLARGHEQPGDLGEVGSKVVGDTVGEMLLVGVAAHVRERQHHDGRPLGRRRPP